MSRTSSSVVAQDSNLYLSDFIVYKNTTASTAVTLVPDVHGNRTYVINAIIVTGAHVMTLPPATGTGNKYRFINLAVQTQALTLKTVGSDVMKGSVKSFDSAAVATHATAFYKTNATQVSLASTATGGFFGGDVIEVQDVASGVYTLTGEIFCTASPTTPLT